MTQALFDPGLQPERTQLAWRRTALSVAVGSVVSLRVLPAVFHDPLWYLPGVSGVVFAAWMWEVSRRRYNAFALAHNETGDPRPGGGVALLCVTLFVVAVGVCGILAIVLKGVSS